MKYKAVVYRTYELELEYTDADAPEMTDPTGKGEFLSRVKDIGEWKLLDVSVDVYEAVRE